MSSLSATPSATAKPRARRDRAAATAAAAFRGGLIGAAVAFVAWILVSLLAATAIGILVVATVLVVGYTIWSGKTPLWMWGSLAAAWLVIGLERWAIGGHGGILVAGAAWAGIVIAARRAGMRPWLLPLLLYPVVCGVALALTDHSVLEPFGISWLWVAAVLGPVSGMRTLFRAPEPRPAASAGADQRLVG